MADREWVLLNPGPANTSPTVRGALVMPDLCHREPEFFQMMRGCRERLVRLVAGGGAWSAVLFTGSGTFRLLPGLAYDPLHDAMKRRGFIIYAGQGDIRTYAFRVSNMGTLTPKDMDAVVAAFASCLEELF